MLPCCVVESTRLSIFYSLTHSNNQKLNVSVILNHYSVLFHLSFKFKLPGMKCLSDKQNYRALKGLR